MKNGCLEAVTNTAPKKTSGSQMVVELANLIVNMSEKTSIYCSERLAIITPQQLHHDEMENIKESHTLSPLFDDLYSKLRLIESNLVNINMAIDVIDL